MKKDREFENILDECLEKIFQGKTVEQCLQDYPDHATALEPMLRTVVQTRGATNIQPRPEFKDRARHQFQSAIREMEPASSGGLGFFPRFKPVWIALTAFLAIIVLGTGAVAASSGALPDSPLYSIKLATESVWLALTPSDIGKAELYARFADRRIDEIVQMADKGEIEYAQQATEKLERQLVAIASLTIIENGASAEKALTFDAAETAPDTDAMLGTGNVAPVVDPEPQSPPEEDAPPVMAVRPDDTERTQTALEDAALSANATERVTGDGETDDEELNREERLRALLLQQAIENPEALEKALENASDSMREILEWALKVAGEGYDEAIDNLR